MTASPIGSAVILVIMYAETFKNDVNSFYRLHHSVFDITLTDNFQYQNQFVDTDNITWRDQGKMFKLTIKVKRYKFLLKVLNKFTHLI
jgi:hypothetical protein